MTDLRPNFHSPLQSFEICRLIRECLWPCNRKEEKPSLPFRTEGQIKDEADVEKHYKQEDQEHNCGWRKVFCCEVVDG